MNQFKKYFYEKKTLKVNQENNIDSIIEFFQYFGRKYNVIATRLDDRIQYETSTQKITQTYKSTILYEDTKSIIDKIDYKGQLSLLIIDNLKEYTKKENKAIDEKISKINEIKNIKTYTIMQDDTFKTIDEIIRSESWWWLISTKTMKNIQ